MIATVCMFLAGKVEETPRPLKDIILVSYEIIHKKDPAAVQKIKQKVVFVVVVHVFSNIGFTTTEFGSFISSLTLFVSRGLLLKKL